MPVRIFNQPKDYCKIDPDLFKTVVEDLKAKSPEQIAESIGTAYTVLQAAMRVFHSRLIEMEKTQASETAKAAKELRSKKLQEKMQEQRRADHKRIANGPLHAILVQQNLSEAEFIENLVNQMKANSKP